MKKRIVIIGPPSNWDLDALVNAGHEVTTVPPELINSGGLTRHLLEADVILGPTCQPLHEPAEVSAIAMGATPAASGDAR